MFRHSISNVVCCVVEAAGIKPVFHHDSYQLVYSLDTKLHRLHPPCPLPLYL